MEQVIQQLQSLIPENFNFDHFTQFALIVLVGSIVVSLIGRFMFGKAATLTHSVSASIAILCVYIANVIILCFIPQLHFILSPLPFVTIEGDYLYLYNIMEFDFPVLCSQVLNMVILAFLMNILESILPKGKNMLTWYFFRILSVVLAICLHYVINLLLSAVVPEGIAQYAPMVLVLILLASLLLGALKLVAGGALAFINPLLGIFYTFFFSHIVGRQVSRAILTTALLTGLVLALNFLEISAVCIAAAALLAYLPLLLILLVMWYIVGKLL